jgi:hypothetical protein
VGIDCDSAKVETLYSFIKRITNRFLPLRCHNPWVARPLWTTLPLRPNSSGRCRSIEAGHFHFKQA